MRLAVYTVALLFALLAHCGDGDDDHDGAGRGSPDQTGAVCEEAQDCYPEVDHADLLGDVRCDRSVSEGYCTHTCETSDDCCAVSGECVSDFPQVCASFEANLGRKFCFLSCSTSLLQGEDPARFCAERAHPRFICRSTGGGVEQRMACLPEG